MYSIYVDGKLLYSPLFIDDGYLVLNPKLTMELSKAGSLTFLIPPKNPMYNGIQKLKSIVTVYDNDEEIFRGRVLYDEKDMFGKKNVYCEGELAFLLDSIQRPYEFTGDIPDLFKKFIDSHNSQVEEAKQFIVGDITVTDPNNYINRSNTNYVNTWDEIAAKLIETHGGYIRSRLVDGKRYIDLVETYGKQNSQTIEFGTNILDISEYITAENVFTVLIPLGAYPERSSSSGGIIMAPTCPDCHKNMSLESDVIEAPSTITKAHEWGEGGTGCASAVLELDSIASSSGDYWIYVCDNCGYRYQVKKKKTDYWTYKCPDCETVVTRPKDSAGDSTTTEEPKRLTIESVNDGKDYIEDDAGIALFGRIVKVHEWDDVTLPENLLNKARALLDASIEMAVTLTLNAIDLHLVNADVERIGLGDSVRVISTPHNLDRDFTCSKIILDMANLDNSEYTFGSKYTTMTEKQSSGNKIIQNAAVTAQQASNSANKANQNFQNYVPNSVYKEDMTQKGIFKVLTNNGATQGIVFDEATGDAYINASYIKSGTLTIGGLKSDSSRFEILDNNGELCLVAGPEGIRVVKGEINATSGSLDSVTILDGITISCTGEDGPKDLSLVKITESDGGAGTVYSITIGEATNRSTPLELQGSSIAIKGGSSITFSADNIIFENFIEAPMAYFGDINVENLISFGMNNLEKQIYFSTLASGGTYRHNAKIYGGNASSKVALAAYDYINKMRIFAYDDVSKHIVSDVEKLYFGNNSDNEKGLHFHSTDEATYPHKITIFGGNGNSPNAIGIRDVGKDIDVFTYNDVDGVVDFDAKLYSSTVPVTVGDGATEVTNQSVTYPFLKLVNLHARFTATDIPANTATTLGTIASGYAPKGFAGALSVYAAGTVCAAYITTDRTIRIKSPAAIAAGEKIYVDGCWIY